MRYSQTHSSFAVALATVALFFGLHAGLSYFGFIPSEVSQFNQAALQRIGVRSQTAAPPPSLQNTDKRIDPLPQAPTSTAEAQNQLPRPDRIKIDAIDIDAEISQPEMTSVSALDAALKSGPVHYPGSGKAGSDRRMFIFGHSSRLPIVQNQAYKSFNGLENVSVGDEIEIESDGQTYIYQVNSVQVVDESEALVTFDDNSGGLTLSTCTTFGARENRVVVKASVIKSNTQSASSSADSL